MTTTSAAEDRDARRPWGPVDWAWVVLLCAVSVGGALLVWFAHRPGRMSFDSSHQLRQVLGEIPLDDWHPAVMTWTWRLLYEATGSVGSMAAGQILLAFGSALALAVVLYVLTRSRLLSLGAVAIMLLPYVINFIGVLWKDTQMMLVFFSSVVALIAVRKLPRIPPAGRVALIAAAAVLLLYGTLVRYNAIFAVVPLVLLLADTGRYRRSVPPPEQSRRDLVRRSVIGLAGFAALAALSGFLFSALVRPIDTNASSQLYLDGIVFTVPAQEIRDLDIPEELRRKLLDAQQKCEDEGVTFDVYWKCFGWGATGAPFETIAFPDEVRSVWFGHVVTRPDRYLPYQASTFVRFLSGSTYHYQDESFWQVPPEYRGVPNRADEIIRTYVVGIGVDTLPWLYRPWFWLLASVTLFGLAGRARHFRFEVRAVSASAALYLLGYFVFAPTTDYRFSYWSAVASTLAGLLLLTDRYLARRPGDRGSVDTVGMNPHPSSA